MLVTGYEIIILACAYFANEYFPRKNKWLKMCGFVFVSKAVEFYFAFESLEKIYVFLISLAVSIILVFYFYKLFVSFKNKFIFFKFCSYDYFIFSVIILLIGIGLYEYSFISKYIGYFFVASIVVFGARVFEADKAFSLSGVFSLGAYVASLNTKYFVLAFVASLLLVNFKEVNKYIYGLISFVIFGIFVLFFKIYDIFSCISLYFAVFLYIILPNNFILQISGLFEVDAQGIISEETGKDKFNYLKQKLFLMSDTLNVMNKNLKFLLVGKINREEASLELSQDIIAKCCKNCESFRSCYMGNINKKQYIVSMLLKAIETGGITKDDVSSGLSCYCNKPNIMVSEINQLANIFLSYEKTMKSEDKSKLIISDELANFSDIFANFAKIMENSVLINKKMSKNVKESMLKSLIDVKEVQVYENKNGIEKISAIITNNNVLKKEALDVIKKVTKLKMEIQEIKHLEYSGISIVNFVPVPKLRIDFAISTLAKEQKNGDNVSVSKIAENKYFVALTDGMGHGESANRTSLMVLELVKSMFAIGLDNDLILQSINKLLLPAGLDNFSTLDACVIDLNLAKCDFIKLGSSVSVLKHSCISEVVSCESLPIGIVQNIKPTIVSKNLYVGDMIFVASDGVVDSYASVDEYKSFINDSKIYNLQSFTDSMISDASYMSTAHPDDMTIIAVNLLKNY